MPFTLAHPAAAIPLRRLLGRAAVLPALILGSMLPDVPYFLPFGALHERTHTLFSVVWFAVPAGVVLYLLWEGLLREPTTFLLPRRVRRRLTGRPPSRSAGPARIVACLAAGALAHIAWDACTHRQGVLVQSWPSLRLLLGQVWGYKVRPYKLLQHLSTLLGCALLVQWMRRGLTALPVAASDPPAPFSARARQVVCTTIAIVVPGAAVVAGFRAGLPIASIGALERFAGAASVAAIAATASALLAFALAWYARGTGDARSVSRNPSGASATGAR